MKKVLALCCLAFVFVATSQAQTITAEAEVIEALTWDGAVQAVNFGQIATGTGDVYLDPNGNSTDNGTGTAQAGFLTATGSAGNAITLSWSNTVLSDGTNDLAYTPEVLGTDEANDQAGAADAIPGAGTGVTLNDDGNYYIWVGGTLSVPSGTPVGNYAGTVTFTSAYVGS